MKKYLEILKTVSLFENINESEIESLMTCLAAEISEFEKKQIVFLEGDPVEKVGIILSGQVQIIKEDFFGNRNIVAVFNEGKLFAETFACSDIRRMPVSVMSVTDSVIMFIDYRKLITTCSHTCSFHSRLIMNMMRIIANKNLLLNQKIEICSKRSTREKLLAYLSAEAKKAKSDSFTIPLNRQELADYLSVDRSAMSVELSKLQDENLIKYDKNKFTMIR